MSWSTHTPNSVHKDAVELAAPVLSDGVETEQREQIQAAVEAARLLSRAVGCPDDEVVVTTSGHANPEHSPRSGWANEMITVSVSARPRAAE